MAIVFKNLRHILLCIAFVLLPRISYSENTEVKGNKKIIKEPKLGFSIFEKSWIKKNELDEKNPFFTGAFSNANVLDVTNTEELKPEITEIKQSQENNPIKNYKPIFDSDNPEDKIVSPDQDPKIAINKDAPGPAIAMVAAYQEGDKQMAQKYAEQWVRYQQNFFFLVRDLTQLVGDALIKQGEIDEDQWVGVSQYLDYEFAKTRQETGALFKPKHEHAMRRIKPDEKNEAEVYYFFTLNCSHCRKMAPNVERLWRAAQSDKKVKMVALTIGPTSKNWIAEYRKYTGLTIPMLNGEKVATKFGVKFVPALVIVSPNSKNAYLKTGEQSFERMYEFLRTVQGLPASFSAEIEKLLAMPIGEIENNKISESASVNKQGKLLNSKNHSQF